MSSDSPLPSTSSSGGSSGGGQQQPGSSQPSGQQGGQSGGQSQGGQPPSTSSGGSESSSQSSGGQSGGSQTSGGQTGGGQTERRSDRRWWPDRWRPDRRRPDERRPDRWWPVERRRHPIDRAAAWRSRGRRRRTLNWRELAPLAARPLLSFLSFRARAVFPASTCPVVCPGRYARRQRTGCRCTRLANADWWRHGRPGWRSAVGANPDSRANRASRAKARSPVRVPPARLHRAALPAPAGSRDRRVARPRATPKPAAAPGVRAAVR